MKDISQHDNKIIYCRRLGGNIPFSYCRQVNDKLPCSLTIACWEMKFDVVDFINEFFTEEEIQKILYQKESRLNKILSILNDIEEKQKS